MNEYTEQLTAYSVPESVNLTRRFFEKYWLYEDDVEWGKKQEAIFKNSIHSEYLMTFCDSYEVIPLTGGLLLNKEEYCIMQNHMVLTGEREFVIIEHFDIKNPPHKSGPPLKFKFPVDASWEELMSGGYVSIELFGMPQRHYYVFGDSGLWGKYVANDLDIPLDLIGYHPKLGSIFWDSYGKMFTEQREELIKILPKDMKERIKNLDKL